MVKGTFRFYEELNDFLPKHRKKIDFEAEFCGKKLIKDIIEEFKVPPTKVDLVLINEISASLIDVLQNHQYWSVKLER